MSVHHVDGAAEQNGKSALATQETNSQTASMSRPHAAAKGSLWHTCKLRNILQVRLLATFVSNAEQEGKRHAILLAATFSVDMAIAGPAYTQTQSDAGAQHPSVLY